MLDASRHEPDHLPRLARAAAACGATGKLCPAERATQLLEAIIQPGDRIAIEGDNQNFCIRALRTTCQPYDERG
jgi:malonate decarboxylase alpha subunit